MPVKDKINIKNSYKAQIKKIFEKALWLFGAFLLSLSGVAGGKSPFAISLITVSGKSNFTFSAIGAGIGYIAFGDKASAVRYFSAVIIASLGTLAINIFNEKHKEYMPMLVAFSAVFSTGFVADFQAGAVAGAYALCLGESVLAMGGAFFFFRAVRCNYKRIKYKALPLTDTTCLMVCASLLLSGLSYISIMGVSPARIIAVLFILACVRYGSFKWGLIVALCLGFALGISREDSMFLIGAYAFSALVCGLFTPFSRFADAVSFTLSMVFFAVCADMGSFSVCCVIESLLAGLIFCILPDGLTEKLEEFFESSADIAPDGSLRQSLVVKLRFASSALAQVSESVRDVREKINSMGNCEPLENELRMVASEQFFSISDMLSDLAFEFNEAELFDYKAAAKIRRMLGEYDIYPENISVIADKFDRMRVEILASSKASGIDSPKIKNEISKICGRDFEKSRVNYSGSSIMMTVIERPNFKMSFGFAQYSAEGKLCGDTVKIVNDSKGHLIFIISDGMGKGGRAALDGAMGAGLLAKLLCAGFGFDSSLKVVNSALLVKSSDESLATLDCACVDLFTGKCEFYKAGAPLSYVVKGNSISKCELSSMPAGILRGIEFAKRTTVLNVDDEIILMSDGVTDVGEDILLDFIRCLHGDSPDEKAQAILDFAVTNTPSRHRDDMSVITAKLMKG